MEYTTVRITKKSMQRIRMIAARRGLQPGVLINRILSNRAAVKAALSVLDEADLERQKPAEPAEGQAQT